ncbi:hypothetical protein [Sphingomonas parapaucimobilis]|uniref:hypothetical protein n=1 Tax=Sphingomonas parapaucimobilis TaxID=28213 RepID=UPI00391DA4BB
MTLATDFVSLEALKRYLDGQGWREAADLHNPPLRRERVKSPAARAMQARRSPERPPFRVYVKFFAEMGSVELVIPNSLSDPSASNRLKEAVHTLAEIESKPIHSLVVDIRSAGLDIIKSAIPDMYVQQASLPLHRARGLVNGIRRVFVATATTELDPQPFFSRPKKEAIDFADGCRFGHTFHGSFGFVLESPLDPLRQPALEGIPPAPFERRVVERFTRGLQIISKAVSVDNPQIIADSAGVAFGANACDHFARMIDETSPEQLMLEVCFSSDLRVSTGLNSTDQFFVDHRHSAIARAAAAILRESPAASRETVFGMVVRLASHMDPTDLFDVLGEREIVVQWFSQKYGTIHVHASLSPQAYLDAVDAHRMGQPVQIVGILERRKNRWSLQGIESFNVALPS